MRARPLSSAGSRPPHKDAKGIISAFDGKQRRASDTLTSIKPSEELHRNHGHRLNRQPFPHHLVTELSSGQHLSPPPMNHSGQLRSPLRRRSINTDEQESKRDNEETKELSGRGGRESRNSLSSRTSPRINSRDPSKSPIPIDERPPWVGTWSSRASRSSLSSLKTTAATSDKSAQRRQSFLNTSPSSASSSRSSSPSSRAAPISPSSRIARSATTSPCNNSSGRSNSISHKAVTPTIGSPLGRKSQSCEQESSRTSDCGYLQGKQKSIFESVQGAHGFEDNSTVHLHDQQQQQCRPGAMQEERRIACCQGEAVNTVQETSSIPPTENSSILIRELLGSTANDADRSTNDENNLDTFGSTVGSNDGGGISSSDMAARPAKAAASVYSVHSLSLVSLVAPTTDIAPFVATALFGQQPQSQHTHDDSDAHSYRSHCSYHSHGSNDLPVNGGVSNANGDRETNGTPSPAQEAMSRLVKLNDRRQRSFSNLFNALTFRARLLHIPGGNSLTESGGSAREGGSSKTTASVTASPPSSKSSFKSFLSLESKQVKEHHLRVSSIESFPKHRPSSTSSLTPKVQYIRDLLRLPHSALTATVQ
ncbi:hypothetical protein EDD21DRAFT_402706 [Dissophora ornata]|nr:hypothetical protein EDD21DRAFT_402706 [Dissophora ornata]